MAWETVRPSVEWGTGITELARIYAAVNHESDVERFVARTLGELGVTWKVSERDLARIPSTGPCIVVANHPFGGVDGMILLSILFRARKDVKVLVNQLLSRIPELASAFVPVDVFGAPDAPRTNGIALREALRHLKGGGMLGLFPAGEVAHFDARCGRLVEKDWHPTVARLASISGAPVLPIYFSGANSALFHMAGLVHPLLRTLLLPRELLNKRGRELDVEVGSLIHPRSLARFEDDPKRIQYLKQRTLMLSARARPRRKPHEIFLRPPGLAPRRAPEPVVAAVEPERLERELLGLPAEQVLVEDGDRVVCWARAPQIPGILREIGRLRELTFREVSEGTGKSIDLDEFDAEYVHLFSFDRKERAVIGAYRMGLTDELLRGGKASGAAGLYTNTLFSMERSLFDQVGPAIEMGRSFVCARYQRSASGLYSLWRGIGRFLVERPRYRFLFGPVSISAAYAETSRAMMVDFVRQGGHMHPLSRYVRHRHPYVRRRVSAESGLPPQMQQLLDVDELSEMVADIEPDRRGVPVLLKQYLRLGGAILGFNVDPEFSGVLDLLVLVDLTKTEPKILAKYLGSDSARSFLAQHAAVRSAAATG